jgi:hypothetical protein
MKRLIVSISLISMSFAVIAQNTCETAPFLDFQDYGTCGTMILHDFDLSNATASGYTIPPCMENTQGANDLWYKFIVPANVDELSFHVFNLHRATHCTCGYGTRMTWPKNCFLPSVKECQCRKIHAWGQHLYTMEYVIF